MSGKVCRRLRKAARRMANPKSVGKMQERNGGFYYIYDNYKRICRYLKKLYRPAPLSAKRVV